MEQEKVDEISKLRTKVKPEWGNQIRSYVLNPYQMVKDHRTEVETGRVDDVLAGDLDIFIGRSWSKILHGIVLHFNYDCFPIGFTQIQRPCDGARRRKLRN